MDYEIIDGIAIAIIWRNDNELLITDYCPFCGEHHKYFGEDGWTEVECFDQLVLFPGLGGRIAADGKFLKQSDGYIVRTRPILNQDPDSNGGVFIPAKSDQDDSDE